MKRPIHALGTLLGTKPLCVRCGFPLHAATKDGCTVENCSQRPMPGVMNQQQMRNDALGYIVELEADMVTAEKVLGELAEHCRSFTKHSWCRGCGARRFLDKRKGER